MVSRDRGLGNPFWSQRVQDEVALEARRPTDLPMGVECEASSTGALEGSHQLPSMPSGKGKGDSVADDKLRRKPTEHRHGRMRTEGLMPGDGSGLQTMGSVQQSSMRDERDENVDDLQRALEGELVGFLKAQNSKLMSELADLKSQLRKGSFAPANSERDLRRGQLWT